MYMARTRGGKVVWVKERVTLTGCSTKFSMLENVG